MSKLLPFLDEESRRLVPIQEFSKEMLLNSLPYLHLDQIALITEAQFADMHLGAIVNRSPRFERESFRIKFNALLQAHPQQTREKFKVCSQEKIFYAYYSDIYPLLDEESKKLVPIQEFSSAAIEAIFSKLTLDQIALITKKQFADLNLSTFDARWNYMFFGVSEEKTLFVAKFNALIRAHQGKAKEKFSQASNPSIYRSYLEEDLKGLVLEKSGNPS